MKNKGYICCSPSQFIMSTSAEMPRYKCHKIVWALKIKNIAFGPSIDLPEATGVIITPDNTMYSAFEMPLAWYERHKPVADGYFITYKDGYKSFSPANEFEDGYSLINSGEYSQYQPFSTKPTSTEAAVLQCMSVRWDGDVESKRERSNAAAQGWIAQHNGFNVITPEGIKMLLERGLIQP
jgi:hypothetical protein